MRFGSTRQALPHSLTIWRCVHLRPLLASLLVLFLALIPVQATQNTFVSKEFGFSVIFPADAKVLPLQESSEGSLWAMGYIGPSKDQPQWAGMVHILPVAAGDDEASMNESLNHGSLSNAADRKLTTCHGLPGLRFSIPQDPSDSIWTTYVGLVVLSRATHRTFVVVAASINSKKYDSTGEAFISSFKVLKS